jgi:alcohol dehydrogenase class IV
MPYVLTFNRAAIEDKMTTLARYLGLAKPSFTAIVDWVLELREGIGIQHTLAEIGVREEHVPRLAAMAEVDPSSPTNPLTLRAPALEELYRDCIEGRL